MSDESAPESTPENPRIEILPIKIGMHLGEHDDPGVEPLEVELGAEPCIVIRPCEEDGLDMVLDVILSRTNKVMAVAMLTAARSLLLAEIKADHHVERLLSDVFTEQDLALLDAAEKPGEL